ncbi:MAG: hypothetical protein R3D80_20055 [Paracoccaceae bacterium]
MPATELPDPALLRELAGRFPGEGYNRLLARCAHGGSTMLDALRIRVFRLPRMR